MNMKARLEKHRLSFVLSLMWAAAGGLLSAWALARVWPAAGPVLPWGAGSCCLAVGWLLFSGRRLPYSNNAEVLIATTLAVACLFAVVLAAAGTAFSVPPPAALFCFLNLWFGLEVFYRGRFVRYRFALLAADPALSPADFSECDIVPLAPNDDIATGNFDGAVVDFQAAAAETAARVERCRAAGVPAIPLITFLENAWGRIPVDLPGALAGIDDAACRPYDRLKPLLDRAAGAIGLVAASPMLLAVACAIRIASPGPVFFRQTRVGLHGAPFTIHKFRTMADAGAGPTPLGAWLRKYHLDELPQLLNVVKGDMALVGPRPETVELAEGYARRLPAYGLRHGVRPGLTSWALIHQGNVSGVAATAVKLSYDLYYLKHASWRLDFYILLKTLWVVAMGVETLASPTGLRVFFRNG